MSRTEVNSYSNFSLRQKQHILNCVNRKKDNLIEAADKGWIEDVELELLLIQELFEPYHVTATYIGRVVGLEFRAQTSNTQAEQGINWKPPITELTDDEKEVIANAYSAEQVTVERFMGQDWFKGVVVKKADFITKKGGKPEIIDNVGTLEMENSKLYYVPKGLGNPERLSYMYR